MDLAAFNRATIVALNSWVTNDTLPPASQFPRIDKKQLVPMTSIKYPAIPGFAIVNYIYSPLRLDFYFEIDVD